MTNESRKKLFRKVVRMRKARQRRGSFWGGLAVVGSVGWMVALPTVGGAFLGRYLDDRFETNIQFTLGLLLLGLFIGGYGVWRLFVREAQ
jgi:ATP synthase protein I